MRRRDYFHDKTPSLTLRNQLIVNERLHPQEEQLRAIRQIAGKRSRDCARYRRLARSGKPANVVTRLPASWPASSGPSRCTCRRRADRNKPVIALQGGAPANHPTCSVLPGKAGGAVRRTLTTTICRPQIRRTSLDRGCSASHHSHPVSTRASGYDQPSS
jgi:hypothetical protein